MKYSNWDYYDEPKKIRVVEHELSLITHNGTTKDDLLNIIKWLWDKFEIERKPNPMELVEARPYD